MLLGAEGQQQRQGDYSPHQGEPIGQLPQASGVHRRIHAHTQNACTSSPPPVVQLPVSAVMSTPVLSVSAETPLQEAVKLLSEKHISGLPVVDAAGSLVGELSEKDLMVRESGFDAGPYVLLLDAVIYLRNPLQWDKQVHQVLGNTVAELMNSHPHSCAADLPLPAAAKLLNERSTQRLFVLDANHKLVGVLTRGDVVRALANAE
jgi:CBS domain-containing protein